MSWNGYDSVTSFNSAMEQSGSVIVYEDQPQTPVLDGEPVYDYCDVEGDEDYGDDGDDYYPQCDEDDDDYDDDDEDCVMLEMAASDVEVAAGNPPAQVADLYASSHHHHQNYPSANFAANATANANAAAFPGSASLPAHSAAVAPRTPRQHQGNHARSRSVSFNDQRQQSVNPNGHQRQDSVNSNCHQQQQSVSLNGHQRQNSVTSDGHRRQLSVNFNGHQHQNSISSNGHRRQLSGSALSTGSFTSNATVGSNPLSARNTGGSCSGTGASGQRKLRKAGTMPDERSHGRGSLAASAAAVAATTAVGARWGGPNYGSAGGGSASFPRNTRGKRVLVKATSMPPAVESRRPSSGAGSATSGGSARTPRLPAGRPQQRLQVFPPTNAPGYAAAQPSPRARLLSAKSPRVPAKSPRAPSATPHGVAQVSFASPHSFRGSAGMVAPPNQQQLRALAHSRSLPPQSPASAARAAAAVANVKAGAFPKSPSVAMSGRPSSGSGTAQAQTRTGAGRDFAPRTPRQLSVSGQSNRAGSALSAALLPVSHALPIRSHSPQQQQQQQQQQRPQLRKPKLPPLDITGIQDESVEEDLSPSVYPLQSEPLQPPQHSRQPSQGHDAKQPLKGILKSSKVQPDPDVGEQREGGGELRDGGSDRKPSAALRRGGSSEAVHGMGGNAERAGEKVEGAGAAERTAGKNGEPCVQFEESCVARKGSGKVAEESRLRAAVAKGQERKIKAEKSVKGTVAKEKGSGVTRKVSREGKSKEEASSPVMAKQCLLPWLSKKA
ncbi:unnamed protein product [Closterium sp. NIES-54]